MPKHGLSPDDPCGCHSGLRYADCHMPVCDAPRGKQIVVGQKLYAEAWAMNAAHYQAQGLYDALAAELVGAGEVRRVLDIGCGLGQGLDALRAAIAAPGRLIVGIDENPDCLAGAAARLGLNTGHPALRRTKAERQLSGYYETRVAPTALRLDGDLLLINVDLLVDDAPFEAWLDKIGPFDAVTLWFSGVHKARSATKVAQRFGAKSDADLREALEDRVMDLAVLRVRPGGFVHLVSRAAGDVESLRQAHKVRMSEALADRPFDLMGVTAHPYEEPGSDKAVQVKSATLDLTGNQNVALSMVAHARNLSTKEATGSLFKLAQRTPFNIAPERANALATAVFGTGACTLQPSEAGANFYAVVEDKAVYLSSRGLASLWCLAHVVFSLTDIASRLARAKEVRRLEKVDLGRAWAELDLDLYLDYARRLFHAEESWPLPLELPDATAASDAPEGRCNNLFFGALSWIVLHEVGHVDHGHERIATADQRRRQEFEADGFATAWILDEAGQGLQREFRVLMIVTALAWLFLCEEVKGQGTTHPAAILRFREAIIQFNLGDRSPALENAFYLLKALFDPANPNMPRRPTPRQAFDWIAGRLEELFPIR